MTHFLRLSAGQNSLRRTSMTSVPIDMPRSTEMDLTFLHTSRPPAGNSRSNRSRLRKSFFFSGIGNPMPSIDTSCNSGLPMICKDTIKSYHMQGGQMDIPEVPYGYCQCGWGGKTKMSMRTSKKERWVRGNPIRFIHGHNARGNTREKSSRWRGGESETAPGYIKTFLPSHPRADEKGYVFSHVLIAEKALSKYLPRGVEVHHACQNRYQTERRTLKKQEMNRE